MVANGAPGDSGTCGWQGRTILIARTSRGTIVRIQQGVRRDARWRAGDDGSAPVDDWVLKSGDGSVLDWILDRDTVPGMDNFRAFLEPMADCWREIVLPSIFHAAREQDVTLPVLVALSAQAPGAGAHVARHGSATSPRRAHRLVDLLAEAKIEATWCVILPGYDSSADRTRSSRRATSWRRTMMR
jgi:hypothetical protein